MFFSGLRSAKTREVVLLNVLLAFYSVILALIYVWSQFGAADVFLVQLHSPHVLVVLLTAIYISQQTVIRPYVFYLTIILNIAGLAISLTNVILMIIDWVQCDTDFCIDHFVFFVIGNVWVWLLILIGVIMTWRLFELRKCLKLTKKTELLRDESEEVRYNADDMESEPLPPVQPVPITPAPIVTGTSESDSVVNRKFTGPPPIPTSSAPAEQIGSPFGFGGEVFSADAFYDNLTPGDESHIFE